MYAMLLMVALMTQLFEASIFFSATHLTISALISITLLYMVQMQSILVNTSYEIKKQSAVA